MFLPDIDSPLSLQEILQLNLEQNPTFASYVYPDHGTENLTEISMLEFVRASYRAGNAVFKNGAKPGDVVAIIANLDNIVYMALIAGLMNLGLVPFPISPRNSPRGIIDILRQSSAHRLLTTNATLAELLHSIQAELQSDTPFALQIEEAPSLREVFPYLGRESENEPNVVPCHSFFPKDTDSVMYIHSSGSTGLPKAIRLSHLNFLSYLSVFCMDDLRTHGRYAAAGVPPFHLMGVYNQLFLMLYGRVTISIFHPTVTKPDALPVVMSPDNVFENARLTQATSMLTVPTFLHIWSHSEAAVKQLAKYSLVFYGGGPLPPSTGDYLASRGVNIASGYGCTEAGLLIKAAISHEDWSYTQFSDKCTIRWVPQGDGTFEAQFLTTDRHRPAIENLKDVRGYATSDLFVPHPTDPKKWKIVGRIDDVVVHSSGEKTVPAPMEAIITSTNIIQGAIIFGHRRDQPGLLVEPSSSHQVDTNDSAQVAAFRNLIWPKVEEANKIAPTFSRLFKEMILITSLDKPLPRVGKGTVARKAAIAFYEPEINNLYATVESASGGDSIDPPKTWNREDIQSWLLVQIVDILSNEATPDPSVDLFEVGFDSLVSTMLRLRIVSVLRKSLRLAVAKEVPQDVIYTYPTVARLTEYIFNLVNDTNTDSDRRETHSQLIDEMIKKYAQGLNVFPRFPRASLNTGNHHVLLTGSTGNMGANLLAGLIQSDSVQRVYALNRPSAQATILDRHRFRFADKVLDISLLESPKVVFLEGNTLEEIPQDKLDELMQNLTLVIHNAWRLDFNLSLSSFESNIKSSRSLIDLARSSYHSSNIRFLFTSSIASAQSWDTQKGPYPEEVVLDAASAVGAGYGESKYVTERILAQSKLQATSFRIGQVCGGAPNGAWATSDWFPILVKSGLTLNSLPNAYGVVSWVPMDAVATAILDTAFLAVPPPAAVNIVHPRPISWTTVIQNIRDAIIREKGLASDALPLIPIQEWVAELRKHVDHPSDDLPALKLLNFFELQAAAASSSSEIADSRESLGLTPLKIDSIMKISPRMMNLEELDYSVAEKWVRYWVQSGM